ncbi:MAG: transcriptional repressor LexA, partial [Patescibacteria group bacterium]|nr:transcriptional repressor LexA [Patescibacteria group bacterium]
MKTEPQRIQKLKRFFAENRRMPSYSELAEILDFKSKNAARYQADKWLAAGVLSRGAGGRLTPGRLMRPVRVLGTVEAGWPSPAEEEQADAISLDDWLIENKEASFMLKVSGDSMIEAGIMPGDVVLLTRGRQAKDGDIVVAEVDKEWTIKFFEKRGGRVRLLPANRKYRPIEPRDEMRVAGVVTAV